MEKKSLLDYQEFDEKRFTKKNIYTKADSVAFVLNFFPGQEMPAHKHPGMNLTALAIQGNGEFTIDDQEMTIMKDELIHCNGNLMIAFKNTSTEKTSIYVILNKADE
ncbi:cupin domain-containing protein [Sporosarcina sp. BP05]|uniref:cupin domain-containing protein n=1 Tax=Sporosarcina sp. BP05 TaxID=2758726 RepID=UPI001646E3DA|nr:cupin domain-containing protein [Sporosarcina sp. BP05]